MSEEQKTPLPDELRHVVQKAERQKRAFGILR